MVLELGEDLFLLSRYQYLDAAANVFERKFGHAVDKNGKKPGQIMIQFPLRFIEDKDPERSNYWN
jgi:hypothetical protein